jgi:SAM-dependent methyltransferase
MSTANDQPKEYVMTDPRFTAAFWDQRYSGPARVWSGRPNPALTEQVAALTPGTALEVGCGEGADAIWLATQGWHVTGVDFSARALHRAAAHTPDHLTARLTWRQSDVLAWDAEPDGNSPATSYDLVTTAFMHFPSTLRRRAFAALAARVAPGGSLVVVGHHPSDMDTCIPRPPEPDLYYTADDLAADLPQHAWVTPTRQARPRTDTAPNGEAVTIHDTVLRAQRRR